MKLYELRQLIRLVLEEKEEEDVLGEPDMSKEDQRDDPDGDKDKKTTLTDEQNTVASVAPGGMGPNMPLGVGPSYPAGNPKRKKKKKKNNKRK